MGRGWETRTMRTMIATMIHGISKHMLRGKNRQHASGMLSKQARVLGLPLDLANYRLPKPLRSGSERLLWGVSWMHPVTLKRSHGSVVHGKFLKTEVKSALAADLPLTSKARSLAM